LILDNEAIKAKLHDRTLLVATAGLKYLIGMIGEI